MCLTAWILKTLPFWTLPFQGGALHPPTTVASGRYGFKNMFYYCSAMYWMVEIISPANRWSVGWKGRLKKVMLHKSALLFSVLFPFSYCRLFLLISPKSSIDDSLGFLWHTDSRQIIWLSAQVIYTFHALPKCLSSTLAANCSPKAKRLSWWSQSVNQLSSHHIYDQ